MTTHTSGSARALTDAEVGDLNLLITERAAELQIPGAAIGIIAGSNEYVLTTGVTNTSAPVEVDPETLFMIGSTTKTITATALLSLVEQGHLDLDAPVHRVLPGLKLSDDSAAAALSLRHLLTHTGGFEGDLADDEDWGSDALARSVDGYASLPQHSPPGAAFSYSNAGLRLAGHLLTAITGTPYEQAVRDLVLDPLGMNESFFFPWEVYSRRHAVGHVAGSDGPVVAHTWGMGRSAAPEGGLVSSIGDQLRYMRFHLDGTCAGRAPVSEAMRREMQRSQVSAAPPFDAVGLPWLLMDHRGQLAVTHGGNIAGVQVSNMLLLPQFGFAVTSLTNAGAGRQLGLEVTDWCLDRVLSLPRPTALAPHELGAAELAEYAGRYDSGFWGMDLTPSKGGLVASFTFNQPPDAEDAVLPPPMALAFCGTDEIMRAVVPEEVFGRFQRDSNGAVVRLLCQGRALHRRN
ncbi:serine hydrolase domain-containing protein [Streptomyces chartreusis]